MELAKDIFVLVGGTIGLLAFAKGIVELIESNAMRRYEKFQHMSVRFDESPDIQKVCAFLHDNESQATGDLTKQQKEVFICFLEEIYFMMNSGIMKRDLALYTFGYYAAMAIDSEQFWHDLRKSDPFYVHFLRFCKLAQSQRSRARSKELAY